MSETGSIEGLIQIARVLKSNGVDGELLLGFRDIDPDDINLKEPVFIEFDGLPVPFFILSLVRKGSSKAIVRLNDINNLEDAEEVVGKAIYSPEENWEDLEEELPDLEGWTIYAEDGTKLGVITSLEDIPGNLCINVETDHGSVMIPLHEDFIVSTDTDSRSLTMCLPEGLLDV